MRWEKVLDMEEKAICENQWRQELLVFDRRWFKLRRWRGKRGRASVLLETIVVEDAKLIPQGGMIKIIDLGSTISGIWSYDCRMLRLWPTSLLSMLCRWTRVLEMGRR
jgi:hypothetical protein